MTRNIPLSMDGEMLKEIHAIVSKTKESRSAVMRRLIRLGLDKHKSTAGPDRNSVFMLFMGLLISARDGKPESAKATNAALVRDAKAFTDLYFDNR